MYRILPVSITSYIHIHVHACKKCNSPPTHWILNLLGTSWMHRKQWSKKAVMIKSWQVELLLSNPTFISALIFISKILSSLLLEKKDKWSLLTDPFSKQSLSMTGSRIYDDTSPVEPRICFLRLRTAGLCWDHPHVFHQTVLYWRMIHLIRCKKYNSNKQLCYS